MYALREMGGYVLEAIRTKRTPKNANYEANKQLAKRSLSKQEGMEAMDKYVSYKAGTTKEQIPYSLPMNTFTTVLENAKRLINNYMECPA